MEVFFLVSAISLADVRAARGGLDGGDGIPERASGIPLSPYKIVSICAMEEKEGRLTPCAGSGVMESSQTGVGINAVRGGEDIGLTVNILAIAITTTTFVFTGSHCYDFATVASKRV